MNKKLFESRLSTIEAICKNISSLLVDVDFAKDQREQIIDVVNKFQNKTHLQLKPNIKHIMLKFADGWQAQWIVGSQLSNYEIVDWFAKNMTVLGRVEILQDGIVIGWFNSHAKAVF